VTLTSGTKLGSFRILELLGAGGMGEVYRAQDTSLGRDVALKVLPEEFARDPERLQRFEREARMLASLNHPNIATLHGLQQAGYLKFLEMELVPGETLMERLARGRMPIDLIVRVFKQIAEALEAAHAAGIVHRDLKPGNVKITPEGRVKVLDFGLAKAADKVKATDPGPQAPTYSTAPTVAGMMLGTVSYMSPEQIRGRALDRRADIWAFGCMLYEAVAGRRPFNAETTTDIVASILKDDPDWVALQPAPAWLARMTRRCLTKDPDLRLHDIADARIELGEALHDPALLVPGAQDRGWRRMVSIRPRDLAMGLTLAVLVLVAALVLVGRPPAPVISTAPSRLSIALPAGQTLAVGAPQMLALSPDGSRIVYVATEGAGRTELYLRSLDKFEPAVIPGSEGASAPFFSSDGEWIGFFSRDALFKVPIRGGPLLRISDSSPVWSASWGPDGTVLFATTTKPNGIWRVAASGGTPERLTESAADEQHAFPQALPGGANVLFSIATQKGWQLAVLSLADRKWRRVGQTGLSGPGAQYVPTGHVVYAAAGGLVSIPFDAERGEASGVPTPLADRIDTAEYGAAPFAISRTGALIYLPGGPLATRALVLLDGEGRTSDLFQERASYAHPAFSPDGRRIAVAVGSDTGRDIWIYDVRRGSRTRITADGVNDFPVWSADGSRIAFYSANAGAWTIYQKNVDGSGETEAILKPAAAPAPGAGAALAGLLPGTPLQLTGAHAQFPGSWSPDGSALAFEERKASGERDIWIASPDGEAQPFLVTSFDEGHPRFSPDGRWLAYESDESSRREVYVQPYPGPGEKWTVSIAGGSDPAWSADGRRIYFREGTALMVADVTSVSPFTVGRPRVLFEDQFDPAAGGDGAYAVSPAAQQFVLVHGASAPAVMLHLVLNWFNELNEVRR
jgi:Tol biopolymer transport system component